MSQYSDPLTENDLWSVAPIFSSTGLHPVSDTRVRIFLAQATLRVNPRVFGEKTDDGILLMCAHLLCLDVRDNLTAIVGSPDGAEAPGVAGAIASEAAGPISTSYAAGGGLAFTQGGQNVYAEEVLATTPWGKRFVELKRTVCTAAAY